MPRLDRLPQINRSTLLTFPAQVNDTVPFVVPGKPLSVSRLAIVTTAGLHRRGDRLFVPGDQTYRVIASDTPTADIVQSHTSIGFDRAAIMRDLNIPSGEEGHMAMKPAAGGDEIARWFWAETAMGQLVRRVRDRLDASDDPRWKTAAFGTAR